MAFISNERYERLESKKSFLDVAPELVVEVLSPNDSASALLQKLREYFSVDVRLVWVADPTACSVFAYRSVTDIREFSVGEILIADDVLPGFEVNVEELFEE